MRDEQGGGGDVRGVVVGWHLGARRLEQVAVADGSVADEPPAGDIEILGPGDGRGRR